MCIRCDELLTIKHINFYLLVQISLKQEQAIIQLSHYMFYLKKSVEKIFNYLKLSESNKYFWKE